MRIDEITEIQILSCHHTLPTRSWTNRVDFSNETRPFDCPKAINYFFCFRFYLTDTDTPHKFIIYSPDPIKLSLPYTFYFLLLYIYLFSWTWVAHHDEQGRGLSPKLPPSRGVTHYTKRVRNARHFQITTVHVVCMRC